MFKKLICRIKCCPLRKLLGGLITIAGAVLLLCFLPGWVWGAMLGFALIGCGVFLILT